MVFLTANSAPASLQGQVSLWKPVADKVERERGLCIWPRKEGFPEIVLQSLAFSPLLQGDGGINAGASFFASDMKHVKGTGGSSKARHFQKLYYSTMV